MIGKLKIYCLCILPKSFPPPSSLTNSDDLCRGGQTWGEGRGVTTQCNSEFSNGLTVTHADNPECRLGFVLETHLTRETVSLRNEANVA